MAGAALDHVYRYPFASQVGDGDGGGAALRLATSDSPARDDSAGADASIEGLFFAGTLRKPRVIAESLVALAAVARSRFHVPPAMLARLLAQADPVVTGDGAGLRLESFSACCGAYARLDLLDEIIDEARWRGRGTTNVDFNQPMCAALARVRRGGSLALSVGREALAVQAGDERVVERKVALPLRWLAAFVEVQAYCARMTPRFEVSGAEARRLLRGVRASPGQRPCWVVGAGRGLRLSQRPERSGRAGSGDGVRVGGVERLTLLAPLAKHARALRIYGDDDGQASAWELDLGGARWVLVLSADVWRGFSGEGQALAALARADRERVAAVRATLHWQPTVEPAALASELGRDVSEVERALVLLGARGLVGYDLARERYFHRELPFDLALVEATQPRLRAARALVAAGDATLLERSEHAATVAVRGSGVRHRVRLALTSSSADSDGELGGGGARCTCTWFAKHQGRRGPCKHVLAAQILVGGDDDESSPAHDSEDDL